MPVRNRLAEAGEGAAAARDSTMDMLPMIGAVVAGVILVFVIGYFAFRKKPKPKTSRSREVETQETGKIE